MAKFSPLIGSFCGKLGALVFYRNNTVRDFVYHANEGPIEYRKAFRALTKQYLYSDLAYKEICRVPRRKGEVDGGLGRQCGVLVTENAAIGERCSVLSRGLLPAAPAILPGEFGSAIASVYLDGSVLWNGNHLEVYVHSGAVLFSASDWENGRYAVLIMNGADAILGNWQTEWAGVVMGTFAFPVPDQRLEIMHEDHRLASWDYSAADRIVVFLTIIATWKSTGQDVIIQNLVISGNPVPE